MTKRIIDGLTYNTATSRRIGMTEWEDEQGFDQVNTLYQTRGGAFFTIWEKAGKRWNQKEKQYEQRTWFEVTPLTSDEAAEWIVEGEVELLDDVLGEPPEAEAEAVDGTTIFVRLPAHVIRAVEASAQELAMSLSQFVREVLDAHTGQKMDCRMREAAMATR